MRCWLRGAVGGRPCAAARRAARTCAVRTVSFASRSCGVVRRAMSRDVARANGSGRRAARSERAIFGMRCLCLYMARPRVCARLAVCRPSQSTCFEHDVPGSAVAWYVGRTILVSIPRSRTPHTHWGTASDAHTRRVPSPARARLAFKVARCGGVPLICCGAATSHNAALVAVTGCAQRSPGYARRRTPPLPHGYV